MPNEKPKRRERRGIVNTIDGFFDILVKSNKVWRAYRVVPVMFTSCCLLMLGYALLILLPKMSGSYDAGAVIISIGISLERCLSSYTKTG